MKKLDLTKYGISGTTEIIHNPSYEELFVFETDPSLEGYEKGWSLLMAERIPLGGVRVVNGRGKNAYPKGLRRNGG